MRTAIPLLALALAGCQPATGPGGETPWAPGGTSGDNTVGGATVPNTAPTRTIAGDLADGSAMDLSWAAPSYCWPATENVNFTGNHVVEAFQQPRGIDVYLRLVPDSGVDVSLYAIQDGTQQTPPNVTSPFECAAMYDQSSDSNPGQPEVLYLANYIDFWMTVGVAGANGATSGGYELQIWEVPGANYDTGL